MTGTATWTTTNIPAHLLAAGDRVDLEGHTVTLIEAVDHIHFVSLVGEDPDVYVVANPHPFAKIAVHVPDEPVDGYDLFKPRPGWSPLGCTCLSRRGDDRNWTVVATDDGCASHGVNDLYDD